MLSEKIKYQIRRRMESRELTPRELDELATLHRGTVWNILNDKSLHPSVKTMLSIANALDCKVDDLIANDTQSLKKEKNGLFLKPILFQEIVETTLFALQKYSKKPKLDTVISIIERSYIFSIKKKKEKVDKDFISWEVDELTDKDFKAPQIDILLFEGLVQSLLVHLKIGPTNFELQSICNLISKCYIYCATKKNGKLDLEFISWAVEELL